MHFTLATISGTYDIIAMVGTSVQSCWLAEAFETLRLLHDPKAAKISLLDPVAHAQSYSLALLLLLCSFCLLIPATCRTKGLMTI